MFLPCLLCCELKIRPSYLCAGYNQGLALGSKSNVRHCSGSRESVIIDGTGPDYFHCPTNDGHHCREQRREILREKWDGLSASLVNGTNILFLTSITKHICIAFTFLFLAEAFLLKPLSSQSHITFCFCGTQKEMLSRMFKDTLLSLGHTKPTIGRRAMSFPGVFFTVLQGPTQHV